MYLFRNLKKKNKKETLNAITYLGHYKANGNCVGWTILQKVWKKMIILYASLSDEYVGLIYYIQIYNVTS